VAGGEPSQGDGEDIFGEAEGDVGDGLGRWSDGGADGSFAGVGVECDEASEKRSQKLLGGSELGGGAVGEQRGDRDTDEGVEGGPDEIEGGDFVGEEFDGEERGAGGDHGPGFEELESWREREISEAGEQAEGGDGGVNVDASGEGDGSEEGEKFGKRDLQPIGQMKPQGAKAGS
jgi:hypothetical protein